MADRFLTRKEIRPGDIVFHLLYGKEWLAIILREMTVMEKKAKTKETSNRELMLVSMLPGLKYDRFFASHALRNYKMSDSIGFVSKNWLLKLES